MISPSVLLNQAAAYRMAAKEAAGLARSVSDKQEKARLLRQSRMFERRAGRFEKEAASLARDPAHRISIKL
jgi:hypothetical protein